jgi:hypothetical protein
MKPDSVERSPLLEAALAEWVEIHAVGPSGSVLRTERCDVF